MLKQDLSVGELSRRSDIPVSTIHFYETKGLVKSWRNNANHRRYSRHVLRRLAVIRVAQRAGVSLGEIREVLSGLPHDDKITQKDWQRISDKWRTDLDGRITRLVRMRDRLNECIGCGCLSLDNCPLRNPEDTAGQQGHTGSFMEDEKDLSEWS